MIGVSRVQNAVGFAFNFMIIVQIAFNVKNNFINFRNSLFFSLSKNSLN